MILNCSKMPRWHWISKQNPLWRIRRLPLTAYLWERRYAQNYTVHLKVADGARTWQRELSWLSSSYAQEVNMLQECAIRQHRRTYWWTAGIRRRGRRAKEFLNVYIYTFLLVYEVQEVRQLQEVEVWCRLTWVCLVTNNKSDVQKHAGTCCYFN